MENLKPCPFCGHKATWQLTKIQHCQLHGDPYQDHILGCFSSKCEMKPYIISNFKSKCIKAWNNRNTLN